MKQGSDENYYHFFLFNDLLAYGKEIAFGKYMLQKKIPIDAAFRVRDVSMPRRGSSGGLFVSSPKTNGTWDFGFQILNSVESMQVYAKTPEDKGEWMCAIERVIAEYRNTREELLTKEKKNALAVLQTEKMKYCQRQRRKDGTPCSTKFGMFKRRYNCHKCGVLCCSECAPYRVFMNAGDGKKYRVCTSCVFIAMDSTKENRKLYDDKDLPSKRNPLPLTPKKSTNGPPLPPRKNKPENPGRNPFTDKENSGVGKPREQSSAPPVPHRRSSSLGSPDRKTPDRKSHAPPLPRRKTRTPSKPAPPLPPRRGDAKRHVKSESKEHGTLKVLLLSGRNLRMARRTPSPVVVLESSGQDAVRSRAGSTDDPEWNQVFVIFLQIFVNRVVQELRMYIESLDEKVHIKVAFSSVL
uniref:FYVE-type domain-containing protein n=1 Tax=Lotharella globosa TaxID=91324 RepID=A0A7S3YKZ3_9EUKA